MFPKGDRASARSPVKPGPGRAKAGPPGSAEPVGGTWRRLGRLPQSMGWLPFTTLVLCILGLVDSAYQAYADYAGTGLLGQGRCLFSGAERSRDVGARDAGRRLRGRVLCLHGRDLLTAGLALEASRHPSAPPGLATSLRIGHIG